ncbi:TonB-dependent receptor [Ravibacter arvi]|uniref:TonB-dependent receptor n=1 Tax=Ravibacter arvi TaxID=2051041 RepID=A0ABP8LVI7_9BACT
MISQGLLFAQSSVTLSGFVKEAGSGELLPGVSVYVPGTSFGTVSNNYGFYSLTLPVSKDTVEIAYSSVAFTSQHFSWLPDENLTRNVSLVSATELKEVTVSAARQKAFVSQVPQMSKIEVPIAQVKKIPGFMGEKDVLKVLQLMPGVQKGSEGQAGLYVRGGGPDQNLVILDEAIVYNANHLFGFFSIFNSDALKSVELTKGGFPAQFGGRLSSVLEMNMKEGNKEKLKGEGGIGLVASRLTLEGPLSKGKSSFLVSGRRTYIDILAKPFIAREQRGEENKVNPGYYFYDLNAKVNYDFGDKDKLYLSGYLGQDKFSVKEKGDERRLHAGLDWGNVTGTLRWNHVFNSKLFANTSLIFSSFKFGVNNYFAENVGTKDETEFSLSYLSRIRDIGLKSDFDYYPHPAHAVRFGVQAIRHQFTPSALVIAGSLVDTPLRQTTTPENSVESGLYVQDVWQIGGRVKLNAGFRLSMYQSDSIRYLRPEPRLSAAVQLADKLSFKASYAEMNQYVHLLSNTGLGLPTDLWVPTTRKVKPQQSRQVAAGFAKDLEKPGITLTLEGYYKHMNDILNYKEGASFLSFQGDGASDVNWQNSVTSGKGWSYGAEFLVQRKAGRLSGWVGYTLSWTYWKFPELNGGKIFFPRYDRRHDISVVGIYELTKKIHLSAVWVYGTGNALTLPVATYSTMPHMPVGGWSSYANPGLAPFGYGRIVSDYGEKNSFRAEPYHRMDISIQFIKQKKRYERVWDISFYNLYNRRNPFFYSLDNNGLGRYQLKRYSLFPIIPSVSYGFKF